MRGKLGFFGVCLHLGRPSRASKLNKTETNSVRNWCALEKSFFWWEVFRRRLFGGRCRGVPPAWPIVTLRAIAAMPLGGSALCRRPPPRQGQPQMFASGQFQPIIRKPKPQKAAGPGSVHLYLLSVCLCVFFSSCSSFILSFFPARHFESCFFVKIV